MESYNAYETFITAIIEKTILTVSKYRPQYRTTNTRLVRLRMLKLSGYASSNRPLALRGYVTNASFKQ